VIEKKLFFLCGVFRCGNTLLRSIINQNPNFLMTPNSVVPEILYKLILIRRGNIFQEENNYQSYSNVINNIIPNYYSNFEQEFILEQGPWGTPDNYKILQELNLLPSKFVFLIRPLNEIMASWIKLNKIPIYEREKYCDNLMSEYGSIGHAYLSIKNLIEKNEKILFLKYHDLCANPEKQIKILYDYLEISYYRNHYFKGLKDVENITEQTKIRTEKIEVLKYNYNDYVDKKILDKYEKINNLFNNLC
tara:strand:+ start:6200 stop:6943 length:744 start_codon:yes stop_codon:yes gene_type:complete